MVLEDVTRQSQLRNRAPSEAGGPGSLAAVPDHKVSGQSPPGRLRPNWPAQSALQMRPSPRCLYSTSSLAQDSLETLEHFRPAPPEERTIPTEAHQGGYLAIGTFVEAASKAPDHRWPVAVGAAPKAKQPRNTRQKLLTRKPSRNHELGAPFKKSSLPEGSKIRPANKPGATRHAFNTLGGCPSFARSIRGQRDTSGSHHGQWVPTDPSVASRMGIEALRTISHPGQQKEPE